MTEIDRTCAQKLLAMAAEARGRAYAPYSGFHVGAAILFENGETICGCNVENASYGLSMCAERGAMIAAVAKGLKKPVAVAVSGEGGAFCPPCGACRQFLAEFNPDMQVMLEDSGDIKLYTLKELLPVSFSLEGLSGGGKEQ
ncbi:MAG: cytidine deaminase [Synergistes sp.]|nr:cytidine deaminase [Synergistes sp.]MCR5335868.1 cytidine deaminase [Synergistes sp.]